MSYTSSSATVQQLHNAPPRRHVAVRELRDLRAALAASTATTLFRMDLTAQHFCTSHFLQPVAADMWQSTSNSVVATSRGAVDDERHGFTTVLSAAQNINSGAKPTQLQVSKEDNHRLSRINK